MLPKLTRKNDRRTGRVAREMAQTLSVASQMALLCPTGMDVWMRRELTAGRKPPGGAGVRR